MKFIVILIYVKFAILFQDVSCNKSTEIELIANYMNQNVLKSLNIIAYICWNKAEKYEFLNQMFRNNIFAAVYEMKNVNISYHFPPDKILYLIDLNCDFSDNIMKAANERNLYAAPFKWLLLTNNIKYITDTETNLLKYDFLVDSRVTLVYKSNKNEFDLIELYKKHKGSEYIDKIFITKWILGSGFQNTKLNILPSLRQNLNKTVFTAGVVILDNDTYNHLTDDRFKHIEPITKISYIFTNYLIDIVNGNRKFIFVDTWGYLNKSDNSTSYKGMIGLLQRGEADIGGTSLLITAERLPIMEYIAMTTPTKLKFIFRQPPLSYVTNIFTLPFSRDVWLSSILLCILTSVLLYIAVSLEWFNSETKFINKATVSKPTMGDMVLVTIGAVAQQGAVREPRGFAGRLVMLCAFSTLMFLYVCYSANIVALLQSSATNIRTLEDLLNSRLELGADDIIYNRYYFKTAAEPIQKAIYERKIARKGQKSNFMKVDVGVAKIREGFFAFHANPSAVYKFIADTFFESEKCGLQEILFLQVFEPYLAVRKNSTYKEIFKTGFRLIRESGIQAREVQRLYTKKPECHSGSGNFVSVGLIDSYPAFLVLGSGMGLSLLLFLIETFIAARIKCLI